MDKKRLIKALQDVKGNPDVGINVLTESNSSEFWSLGKNMLKVMDGGQSLAIFQCRLRKAIPFRVLKNLNLPVVDGVNVDLADVLTRLKERFDFAFTAEDLKAMDIGVQQMILTVLHTEISDLVRINEDFIRLCGNKPEHQKYHYVSNKE